MNHKKLRKVKEARNRLGFTLRELEEVIGVSRQALSAYERGEYPPRQEVWKKLKKALKLKGTVESYWGRSASAGKARLYHEGDKCYVKGCDNAPISKGLCRKHYQLKRYHEKTHGVSPEITEA
jgi:transcriptional regulator with XRE-family HTH domain